MFMNEKVKRIVNISLCIAAIVVIFFYIFCAGSCRYLKGNIFGLDLKYIGLVYMAVIIGLNLLKKDFLNSVALAAGLGGEIFLVAFQIREGRFCPFCVIFGAIVIVLFILNLKRFRLPIIAAAIVAGFFFFYFFFHGALVPTYDFGMIQELFLESGRHV